MDAERLFGPITTRTYRINSFDTFILSNIPYGDVRPRDVQWGSIQYDGPDAPGIAAGKPALQWHFGGVAYPISKAIRISYEYTRTWDGSNAIFTQSIFLGFQERLTSFILPQPVPYVPKPTQTFRYRVLDLGTFGGVSTHTWASDAAVLASEAPAIVTTSVPYDSSTTDPLHRLMKAELTLTPARFDALVANSTPVDVDGPAQDSDSHHVFPYTFATLLNEPQKYDQLLFWYFAGKPFRVTKAMRIPLDIDYQEKMEQPSVVVDAVEEQRQANRPSVAATPAGGSKASAESRPTPIGIRARLNQLLEYDEQREAARNRAESQEPSAQQSVAESPQLADPAPLGRALFIGFAGSSSDPAG